jgi:hypothetical protein
MVGIPRASASPACPARPAITAGCKQHYQRADDGKSALPFAQCHLSPTESSAGLAQRGLLTFERFLALVLGGNHLIETLPLGREPSNQWGRGERV